jgi:hypothetical protein
MTTTAIHGVSGMFCGCSDVADRWRTEESPIHDPANERNEEDDAPGELRYKCTLPMNQPHASDQRQADPKPNRKKNDCDRAMLCEGFENVHERDGSNETELSDRRRRRAVLQI